MENLTNWMLVEEDNIATLTLNRPHSMNDLTLETLLELRLASKYLGKQDHIRAVILRGEGEHFSSGIKLEEVIDIINQPVEVIRSFVSTQQDCLDTFERLEKPTIARLHGFCIGGGLMLALCCDFRLASQRTIFSLPEIKLGIPMLWGTHRVSKIVGLARAKEMILLGKRYRANTALQMGLVHQVVQPEKLDKVVSDLANQFARTPVRSAGIAKRIINQGYDLPPEASQELELGVLDELLENSEVHEALKGYLKIH